MSSSLAASLDAFPSRIAQIDQLKLVTDTFADALVLPLNSPLSAQANLFDYAYACLPKWMNEWHLYEWFSVPL